MNLPQGLSRLGKMDHRSVVWAAVVVGLCLYLAVYLAGAYRSVTYPYQLDYGEGPHLGRALAVAEGRAIYTGIEEYPYVVDNYPPVFDLVSGLLVRAFGVSFWGGRAVSVAAALFSSVIIALVAMALTGRRWIGLVCGLLFPAAAGVGYWSVLYRVDMLGLLFSLGGIALVYRYQGTSRVYLSVPLFLLGLYTRQSLIAAPLSALIYLFSRDRRRALNCLFLLAVGGASVFLVLDHVTSGQFHLHIVKYTVTTFQPVRAVQQYLKFVRAHPILLGLATAYALYSLSRKENSLIVDYFIVSGLVALTVGKVGSSVNYFLEVIAASCILTGLLIGHLRHQDYRALPGSPRVVSMVPILLATLLLVQLAFADPPHQPSAAELDASEKVSAYVRDAIGMVISEDMGLLVLNGKRIYLQPWIMTQLAREGIWNQSGILGDIRERSFSLIILKFELHSTPSGRFTPEMIRAMERANYTLLDQAGPFWVYH